MILMEAVAAYSDEYGKKSKVDDQAEWHEQRKVSGGEWVLSGIVLVKGPTGTQTLAIG